MYCYLPTNYYTFILFFLSRLKLDMPLSTFTQYVKRCGFQAKKKFWKKVTFYLGKKIYFTFRFSLGKPYKMVNFGNRSKQLVPATNWHPCVHCHRPTGSGD